MAATRNRSAGFSLLEVLLTLFIVTVGLLGLVGMQVVAQEAEAESYQRAQALVLMNDIVDRINTNRKAAICYSITTDPNSGAPHLGTAGTGKYAIGSYSCPSLATNPLAVARAQFDLQAIDDLLLGATETTGGGATRVGAMLGARACIGFDAATQTYSVAVAWQGLNPTFSPATWDALKTPAYARNCALSRFGANDAQRRIVWTTFLVANLSS